MQTPVFFSKLKGPLSVLILLIATTSCEKVIDLDLNEADPQWVVEAILSDESSESKVLLSQSGSVLGEEAPSAISGANVQIEDSQGNLWQLSETAPGTYNLPLLSGIPGEQYQLKIVAEGWETSSVSTMPSAVKIDSLHIIDRMASFGAEGYGIQVQLQDPPGEENYYRFRILRNGDLLDGYTLFDDALFDGEETRLPLFPASFEQGDTVEVQLFCMERAVFTYFNGLANASSQGLNSSVPGNPDGNLEGNILGYFGAVTTSSKRAFIP